MSITHDTLTVETVLQAVRRMAPSIFDRAAEIERGRRVPADLLESLGARRAMRDAAAATTTQGGHGQPQQPTPGSHPVSGPGPNPQYPTALPHHQMQQQQHRVAMPQQQPQAGAAAVLQLAVQVGRWG